MKEKLVKKTHYEIFKDSFFNILGPFIFGRSCHFYDIINIINEDENIKNTFEGYWRDTPCKYLMAAINDKIASKRKLSFKELQAEFYEIYIPYLFHEAGEKIFRPTEDLMYLLLETELNNIDTDLVRTPFQCIYVAMPEELNILNPSGIKTDGLYIAILEQDAFKTSGLSEHFQEKYKGREILKHIILMAISDKMLERKDEKETLYYWNLVLLKGNVFDHIKECLDFYDTLTYNNKYQYNRNFLERLFSFTINMLLYINNTNEKLNIIHPKKIQISNIKNKAKKRKAFKRNTMSYYKIGTEIILDPNHKKIFQLSEEKSKTTKFTNSWLVRGHWKQQAFGEKFSKRKLIWILPYVKGNTNKNILIKEYKIK